MSLGQILLIVAGAFAALVLIAALFSARLIVRPGRARIWGTPKDVGLDYTDVAFDAQDGAHLVGWFMPAPRSVARPAPTIIFLHGWPWCRMGTRANNLLNDLPGSRAVHLLPFIKKVHDAGYNVLAFDLRNFGDSEQRGVVTGGWLESRDVLGALDFLATRDDVDMKRIGAIGFSQGGTTLTFALPQTDRIRAAIAIQPTSAAVFAKRYGWALMNVLSLVVTPLAELFYRIVGGPPLSSIEPIFASAGIRVPILFIQGTGDRWGDAADVAQMVAAAPQGSVLYPETKHRFEGYTYVLEHPEVTLNFFATHLGV